jgi:hypothetical protein
MLEFGRRSMINVQNSAAGTADQLIAQSPPPITLPARAGNNLGAFANFRFVLNEARTPFFMWAAHDDRWDVDSQIEVQIDRYRKKNTCKPAVYSYLPQAPEYLRR